MDTKVNISQLAKKLASKKNLSQRNAEAFLREFFDAIIRNVTIDKLVRIKGLGTFKLIEVLDRESINVNTGERFVIPGHTRLSFTPDAALRDLVNKPFADPSQTQKTKAKTHPSPSRNKTRNLSRSPHPYRNRNPSQRRKPNQSPNRNRSRNQSRNPTASQNPHRNQSRNPTTSGKPFPSPSPSRNWSASLNPDTSLLPNRLLSPSSRYVL